MAVPLDLDPAIWRHVRPAGIDCGSVSAGGALDASSVLGSNLLKPTEAVYKEAGPWWLLGVDAQIDTDANDVTRWTIQQLRLSVRDGGATTVENFLFHGHVWRLQGHMFPCRSITPESWDGTVYVDAAQVDIFGAASANVYLNTLWGRLQPDCWREYRRLFLDRSELT